MHAMTSYFAAPGVVKSLAALMAKEIADNKAAVPNYTQWSSDDIDTAQEILTAELATVNSEQGLNGAADSVKGEDAVKTSYPSAQQRKAVDAITRTSPNAFALTEAKYLMKFSCKGPFRGPAAFKKRISGKFNEMAACMVPDGEAIDPLRIIVVAEEQLPYSVMHIRSLLDSEYEDGSFSEDGRMYEYVICTSKNLRQMIDHPPRNIRSDDYLFFML